MDNPFEPYKLQFNQDERKELIGKLLKDLRTARKYQQKDIADVLEIPQPTYAGYEAGRNAPPIEILIRLSFFYKVSMDTITGKDFFFKNKNEALAQLEHYESQVSELKKQMNDAGPNPQAKALLAIFEGMANFIRRISKDKDF